MKENSTTVESEASGRWRANSGDGEVRGQNNTHTHTRTNPTFHRQKTHHMHKGGFFVRRFGPPGFCFFCCAPSFCLRHVCGAGFAWVGWTRECRGRTTSLRGHGAVFGECICATFPGPTIARLPLPAGMKGHMCVYVCDLLQCMRESGRKGGVSPRSILTDLSACSQWREANCGASGFIFVNQPPRVHPPAWPGRSAVAVPGRAIDIKRLFRFWLALSLLLLLLPTALPETDAGGNGRPALSAPFRRANVSVRELCACVCVCALGCRLFVQEGWDHSTNTMLGGFLFFFVGIAFPKSCQTKTAPLERRFEGTG